MNSQLLIIRQYTLSFSCLCASSHKLAFTGSCCDVLEGTRNILLIFFPKERYTHFNLIKIKLVSGEGTSLYFCLLDEHYAIWDNYVLQFTVLQSP